MGREVTVAQFRAGMVDELFRPGKNKIPTAELWQSINGIKAREPLCDRLMPDRKVVEALQGQGLSYKGLARKFLSHLGDTVVHLVPYHEGQPEIEQGIPRAECGAHGKGWYATVKIRTLDVDYDVALAGQIEKNTGVDVTVGTGGQGKVIVTLGHIMASGVCVYTVSLIDTKLLTLAAGRAMVTRVARELLDIRGIESERTGLANALE